MNDLISRQAAIDTDGLDEEIRCEMCRNPMHTNRGCDGNCRYDEKLYKKIIQILDKRIKPLPSAQTEIITCGDCRYKDDGIDEDGIPFLKCLHGRSYGGTRINDFCSWAERRTDEQTTE